MNSLEHTDPDGDALTITLQDDNAWITITRGDQELTTGPFPARVLNTEPIVEREADYAWAAAAVTTHLGQNPRAEKAEKVLQQIRELHTADPGTGDCIYCTRGRIYPVPAPCATVRLLEDEATR